MHRSAISVALAYLATGSLAAVAGRQLLPRDNDCGGLSNVPLSSDPEHSSYTFFFDPSVKQVVDDLNKSSGSTFNTVLVNQYCNKLNGNGYESHNVAFTNITQFGPDSKYTVATDKCEEGESRSPQGYYVNLCVGDGTQCTKNYPWAVCGTPGVAGDTRLFCPAAEPSGGNPKAVSLDDPTAWNCKLCTTISKYCQWS
ncbi:uncharacterized protein LY79DRAFT_549184 [Colletotrichum navitas]|uniref:Uncharacterized protein n=1 Tax=Colletotrichum navitas TaxID=681940 RepID=A0AAD8V7N5_9PEZI|nr:uncharacterized protein LY79DRAFT_549184 [Colletotrichum navitas]KAK1594605.1 hypothetical protein LY79DRAFT_549184 [Colletotrichum navitas]